MKKNVFCLLFTLFFSLSLQQIFASGILNPVSGSWANFQMLVLNLEADENAYYSINGTDPETSGFAYDGPVLLELEGDVFLTVAFVNSNGEKSLETVSYSVVQQSASEDEEFYDFINTVSSTGELDYATGDVFSIPKGLEYSFGNDSFSFEQGRELSIDKNMIIHRYLPCTVTDGNNLWRFIVNIHPVLTGLYTRKDVPFEISDWETITFTDRSYIYKIDDGWWEQPKENIFLDRSVNHMISWQSVDYSQENIIKFYVLPPKPSLSMEKNAEGTTVVKAIGDEGYKFGILTKDGKSPSGELFEKITIDTFKGDNFSGSVNAALYFDSVYQGKMTIPFNVHKKMPLLPKITSSIEGKFVREGVNVSVSSPEKNKIFVSVSGPVILDGDYSVPEPETLFALTEDSFTELKKSSFELSGAKEGAAAYRVRAYCVDSAQNKSKVSQYSVIIDQCNYYIDANASRISGNGSKDLPFSDFEKIIPLINKSRFVHIRVKGEVPFPNEKVLLASNCQIEGTDNARLVLGKKSSILVKNASLSISSLDLILAEQDNFEESASLIQLERGVLYLDNVELSAVFGRNGTVINAEKSVVNVQNSGLTSSAENYSSSISGVDSRISVKNSRISTIAGTAVNFSAQGGIFNLERSSCKVCGSMGRIAELFDTHSTILKNTFTGELKKVQGTSIPVYMDSKNYSVEYKDNSATGF